jgi:hypothetical protein
MSGDDADDLCDRLGGELGAPDPLAAGLLIALAR